MRNSAWFFGRFSGALCLQLALVLAASSLSPSLSFAQSGASHGALLNAQPGPGCQNNTGTNPPSYPGHPGGIPCNVSFRGEVLTQGSRIAPVQFANAPVSTETPSSFTDVFGNLLSSEKFNYQVAYGLGNDNYSEFAQDGAFRVRWYTLSTANLVDGLNVNLDQRRALSQQQVVDGMALGVSIQGNKLYQEVPKGQHSSIEIIPVDPFNRNDLHDSSHNPYSIGWVQPNVSWTPHLSIPLGMTFRSEFDTAANSWRYYLDIDGTVIDVIGKYVVYFQILETQGQVVQYYSSVEHLLSATYQRWMQGTITIGYGVDQCVSSQTVALPQMGSLLNVYEATIKRSKRDIRALQRKLNKLPPNLRMQRIIGAQSLRLKKALERLADTRQIDQLNQQSAITALSADAQTAKLLELSSAAKRVTAPGAAGSKESIRAIARAMIKVIAATRPSKRVIASSKTTYNKFIMLGNTQLMHYLDGLLDVSNSLAEIRQNTAQCGALPG